MSAPLIEQGGCVETAPFDPSAWLSALVAHGGWYATMRDGQVGMGWGESDRMAADKATVRRPIASLDADERERVEQTIRASLGFGTEQDAEG